MADPFVAEIRIFPFNFAPQGWAFCNGTILPIAQNTALFSLLGTTYGGNGQTTFALPNLQGRGPMHPGAGPGLSSRFLGEAGGTEVVTLLQSEIPSHSHVLQASTAAADEEGQKSPANALPGAQQATNPLYGALPGTAVTMADSSLSPIGASQPHNNMQPYLTLNFNIALQGIFPPRS